MTKKLALKAEKREDKAEKGYISGVLYGANTENIKIKVNRLDFEKLYQEAGESTLIDLDLAGNDAGKVLIKDIQVDPVKDIIIHLDLYKVDMNKEITTDIPLNFIGESKAVKEIGAILNKNIDTVEVICLPGNLVNHIDVDLSVLVNLDDVIRIKDINTSQDIKINAEVGAIVASLSEMREEEEEEEPTEETAEDAEGAEGEEGGGEAKEKEEGRGKKIDEPTKEEK